MSFFGLMTVRAHEAEIAEAKRELEQLATSIWKAEFRHDAPDWTPLPDLRGLISQVDNMYAGVRSQRDGLRIQMETHRELQKGFDRRFQKMQAELATLRPDAEKHRERVRKASMNLKQNRAKAAPDVRLEAAEPPADPYDTARDSRRDDREIHSL